MTHTDGTVSAKGATVTPPGEYFEVTYANPAGTVKYVKGADVTDAIWALLQEAWDKDRKVDADAPQPAGVLLDLRIRKA